MRAKVAAMRHRRQDKTANLRQLRRLVLLVGLWGCGQAGSQAPVTPVMADLAAQDLAAQAKSTGLETQASGDGHAAQEIAAVPSKPRSREYVGSEVCRSCHKAKHQAWSQDWHQRALTPATGKFVVGNFSGAHFAGTSSEATMFRRGGQPLMRTVSEVGVQTDFPVSYVIGGKRMQDSVTVLPSGFWQVLPVYYHVTPHGKEQAAWVDYNETKQGHIGPEHPFFWTNFRHDVCRRGRRLRELPRSRRGACQERRGRGHRSPGQAGSGRSAGGVRAVPWTPQPAVSGAGCQAPLPARRAL